jgi:hypothetical protein
MHDLHRIHVRKIQQRKRDISARRRGKKLVDGLSVAKSVDPEVFKMPLDLTRVEVPVTYEF